MAQKRITKELTQLRKAESEMYQAEPTSKDLLQWQATILGPEGTPYEDYPFKPPKVLFTTRIYHCNVDKSGKICLDILKDDWNPKSTIGDVLDQICNLIATPNPKSPVITEIAEQLMNDKKAHDSKAKEWTRKYAM